MAELIQELKNAIGEDAVLPSKADRISYSYDGTYITHLPDVVVFPQSTADVQRVVQIARRHRTPIFTRGSGTGLSGGSVPLGGIALVMTRMNRILEIDPRDLLARVQPGVITADLKAEALRQGLFYPVSPSSARISTIGGNIAENAGGSNSFQYGTTGHYVLGLEVVLADGSVIRTGGRTTKNVTGYDLTRLFVGSEGTLGIVTEATLRLLPPPPAGRGTLVASFPDLQTLGRTVSALAAHPARPTSVEFLDRHCLAVLEAQRPPEIPPGVAGALMCEVVDRPEPLPARLQELTAVCEEQGAIAVAGLIDAAAQDRLWKMREALSPATARLKPTKISEDATVPLGAIPAFLADLEEIRRRLEVNLLVFGHAGDGNFHPNIICDRRDEDEMRRVEAAIDEIFASALRHGGTLSGEHGIGLLKLPYMARAMTPETLATMWRVKRLFDPDNLLNPGKMLPDEDGMRDQGAVRDQREMRDEEAVAEDGGRTA